MQIGNAGFFKERPFPIDLSIELAGRFSDDQRTAIELLAVSFFTLVRVTRCSKFSLSQPEVIGWLSEREGSNQRNSTIGWRFDSMHFSLRCVAGRVSGGILSP